MILHILVYKGAILILSLELWQNNETKEALSQLNYQLHKDHALVLELFWDIYIEFRWDIHVEVMWNIYMLVI